MGKGPQLHFTSLTPRPPPASFLGHHCPMQATNSLIPRTLPASLPEHYQPHSQNTTSLVPRTLPASFPEHYRPHSQNTTGLVPRTLPALFPGHHHHNWDGDYQSSLTSVSASPLEAPSLPFPLSSPPPSQTGWNLRKSLCRITKPHTRNQHLTIASNRHNIQPIRELPIQEK